MAACPPSTSAAEKSLEAKGAGRPDIEVFKILNGMTRIDPASFWEVRQARNGARLVKVLATNGRRQRQSFFSYRVVQEWNLLPADVKTAPSLISFKNRLDEQILKECECEDVFLGIRNSLNSH